MINHRYAWNYCDTRDLVMGPHIDFRNLTYLTSHKNSTGLFFYFIGRKIDLFISEMEVLYRL